MRSGSGGSLLGYGWVIEAVYHLSALTEKPRRSGGIWLAPDRLLIVESLGRERKAVDTHCPQPLTGLARFGLLQADEKGAVSLHTLSRFGNDCRLPLPGHTLQNLSISLDRLVCPSLADEGTEDDAPTRQVPATNDGRAGAFASG